MFSSGLGRVKSRQEFRPNGDDDDDDDNNNDVVTLSALPRNQRTKNSFDEFLPMISYRQGMAKGSDVVVRSLAFFLKNAFAEFGSDIHTQNKSLSVCHFVWI